MVKATKSAARVIQVCVQCRLRVQPKRTGGWEHVQEPPLHRRHHVREVIEWTR